MSQDHSNLEWMVDVGGQQYGPYSRAALAQWVQDGKIMPRAVIYNGAQQFKPIQFLEQFRMLAVENNDPPPPVAAGEAVNVRPVTNSARAISAEASTTPEPLPNSPVVLEPIDESPQPAPAPPVPDPSREIDHTAEDLTAARRAADDEDVLERDQIVVMGRSRSGKTIFLAGIYGKLWKSLNGMTAKALTGQAHKELIEVNRMLKNGQWPPGTAGLKQVAMEIEYHRRKRLLVALDYAGEKFTDAFVNEETNDPIVKELLRHIDRAAAVMLLVDPSVIAGRDMDASVDDDFGMVQAVQRIRNWPGGDEIPIVLVLTKMDLHQRLIDRAGGVKEFVRQHYPALVRVLKEIPIFQVSAVQADRTPDGKLKPRRHSALINVENPLRYCLSHIHKAEQAVQTQQMAEARQKQVRKLEMEERRHELRHNIFWTSLVVVLLAAGLGLVALIIVYRIG